jgi:hypothetical protein
MSISEIPTNSLPQLRDLYRVNWPEHIVAYNFITNIFNRFEKDSEHRELVKIISFDGKINESGTFAAIMVRES